MTPSSPSPCFSALPAVDTVLGARAIVELCEHHGRAIVTEAVRAVLDDLRQAIGAGKADTDDCTEASISDAVAGLVRAWLTPSLRPVFNLTGTVLHTNLGRAVLPAEAIEAMASMAGSASNLEFDLASGKRGERNTHIDGLIRRLTGAEAAVVVNNNAAAVLLTLNTFAQHREVLVSRGELIEIGGAFRLPDIMSRAGCTLVEVGTTNRTHLKDYCAAISDDTALLMKVHTSNYEVTGFTASVPEHKLVGLAHEHELPVATDLGSGSLVDLTQYGLPDEPTVAATIASGVDLVTFSGDKLLGGPQAGIIAGRKALIQRIKQNPMLRALRVDKITLAALSAVLGLYVDPERLPERLPAIRMLSRSQDDIQALATRLAPRLAARLAPEFGVDVQACRSQVGSGALPVDRLPSAALRCFDTSGRRSSGKALNRLATAFRALPVPVIGRVKDDALWLDLRCLEDVAGFEKQLDKLELG